MGDGLLAAFRVETTSRERACCGAMQTAIAAARAITAHNRGRAEPIDVAFGLHLGDVIYGNIGAAGRLDFTVIGPSVNEAARILDLAKRVGQPILVSASFARDCTCERMVSLGPRRLRGVAKKQEIFALPEGRLG